MCHGRSSSAGSMRAEVMRTAPSVPLPAARRARTWLVTQVRNGPRMYGSGMRRRTGIVIGTCAAMALAGVAGVVVSAPGGISSAGAWQQIRETPAEMRTPVAEHAIASAPAAPRAPRTTAAPSSPSVTSTSVPASSESDKAPNRKVQDRRLESAQAPDTGRERIGRLLEVDRLLGYLSGPRRQEFAYPGASYVKLHFDKLTMLPGDYVTVS